MILILEKGTVCKILPSSGLVLDCGAGSMLAISLNLDATRRYTAPDGLAKQYALLAPVDGKVLLQAAMANRTYCLFYPSAQ